MKLLALAALLAASAFAANLPRPAGDIAITLPDGKVVKPSDYKGKTVVLAFILTT